MDNSTRGYIWDSMGSKVWYTLMHRWVTYDTTQLTLGTRVQYVISLDYCLWTRLCL